MDLTKLLFDPGRDGALRGMGLLLLRAALGLGILMAHGWGKAAGFSELSGGFPDPLGIGSAASLTLAIFGEVVCASLVAVGFMGRLAAVPAAVTMAVAFFIHHAADPFGQKEKAFLYLVGFAALALTGPGRFSIDGLIRRR